MKSHIRFLALLSVLVLLCPLMISSAWAADRDPYVVTCIGDSAPNGNCMGGAANAPNRSPRQGLVYTDETVYTAADGTEYVLDGANNGDKRVDFRFFLPEGVSPQSYEIGALKTYPVLVAEAMNGIEWGSITDFDTFYAQTDYRSMTASMVRSGDVLYALDNSYSQSDRLWELPLAQNKREELAAAVENGAIADADCIIFAAGGNDIFAGPIYELILAENSDKSKLRILKSAFEEGTAHFRENLPLIMEEMQKRNSDCLYILTGVFNPVYQYSIHDLLALLGKDTGIFGRLLRVGNLVNQVIDPINRAMRELADQYDNVIYVDSCGVPLYTEILAAGGDVPVAHGSSSTVTGANATYVSTNPLTNAIHPTVEGHEWIARRILSAIEQLQSKDSNRIRVDIDGMGDITCVRCNGKQTGYTLSEDGRSITLTGNGKKTLRVKVIAQRGDSNTRRVWKCTQSSSGYWVRLKKDRS